MMILGQNQLCIMFTSNLNLQIKNVTLNFFYLSFLLRTYNNISTQAIWRFTYRDLDSNLQLQRIQKLNYLRRLKFFIYQAGDLQLKKLDFCHVSALRGKLRMQSLGPENKLQPSQSEYRISTAVKATLGVFYSLLLSLFLLQCFHRSFHFFQSGGPKLQV